ncbi:hypothetical protein VaNZ11_005461 [Volvox africanus]|uniref:Uncharacterized protein n=1 Tax=Volvox africanus TaxID=51714 RepID=A0ABQ5RYN2_9CHLO|nr:hypothetical protein VaNZ11_005461 [Volvox africanus]
MDEAAVRVFWPPSPPAHAVTSVAVDVDRAWLYTGGSDGAIVRWHLQGAVAPKAYVMLVGHTRPIRHLAPGLKATGPGPGSEEGRYLLSVDDGGGCCLWREPCGRCVLQRWIPEMGVAVFGQLPADRSGPFASSNWLLAALPAVGGGELALRPHPHPPHHHHQHHYQANHHDQQPYAPTPSLLHGVRYSGPGCLAGGGGGGGDGPGEMTALHDNAMKSSRGPVLLVIDWRSLSLFKALDMQPLQQLVCVDMPTAAYKFRFTSSGSHGGGSGGSSGGGASSPTSQQRAVRPPWTECKSGGGSCDSPDPSSVLLCLQWGPCAVPFGHGVGVGNSGSTDSSSYTGGPGRDTMVVVALALTPTGTLYGCVVPYDPYKPPAWVLGCGGARNTPDGGVVGEGGFAGGGARCVGSEQLPGREGQEEPLRPQMEVREPLLSAAVSTNLRWALLGALDSLIVLEARWNAVQSLAAKSMSAKAISTPTPLSGAGVHNVPPRLLQLSYTAKCRISLMHQPGAGMLAVSAGPTVLNRQQSPPSQRSCARQLPRRPGMQGGPCSGGSSGSGSGSGSSAECSTYGTDPQEPEGVSSGRSLRPPVVPVSGHHIHAAAARTGLAQHSHQPHVIRTAAHLLVLGTWEEEEPLTAARVKAVGEMAAAATAAELLGAAARQPHSISGMAGPATATFTTATAAAAVSATAAVTSSLEFVEAGYPRPSELEPGLSRSVLALSSPAQPPRPAAAPNTANCSDSRTSPFPRCTAAVAAVKGIDVPRPPAPVAGTALTPTAAVAVPVAGSNLDQRMADYDDELLTKSCSPDLARLSFAVYLPPRGGGGGSAASSSVLQPPQAQSPSKGRKQQSRPQLQPQLQQPQVLLPLNGSAQVLSGAPAAMDGLHEIESGEGRCQGQAQQSHAQSPARSAPQQELQLQLPGRPSPAQEGEFSGLQVNLATAARGGHGGGGGGGGGGGSGTMAALGAHAGPQETSEKQMHQSLHGEGVGLSLTHGSARPIHHWRQRTNHHRHHHGHDASTRGAVVLQVLSWDGAGRQQVVSLTSDGRILAVQELSAAAAPPAPAAASFGTQLLEARQTGWPSCYSAPSHLADALCCATTAFCGYLPTQGGGDGVCNIGAGDGNCSGRGDVGRGDGGGLEGWVLGVHCYQGDARPATVSVLQWPLSRPHSLPYVARQASPLAAEAAAAIRAVSSSGRERSLAEANLVPLVGSLHDGWAAAAAVTWRAHTARRRRRRRAMLRHGCGRAGGGAAAAAQADHGSVWDFACEEGTDGGCSVRGTVRQYGGYEAVRDGRSDGRGSADAVADDDNGLLPDSEVIRVRRRIDVGKVTKRYCSGNGFAATSAAAATTTIAGDGNSLYGPPASPDVPCRHGGGGRIRRDSSGGGAQRGLPACLYERWDAGQKCIPWSNGKRDCTAQPQDVLAVVRAGNEGVDVGIGSSAPTYTSAAVVSASVLVCDGTAAGEAVVLHCMADGEMHYYDAGAYTVPSVPHCCTADGGFKHATSSLLQASVRGDDDAGHWHADNDGDGYRYDNSGGCGESFGIPVPPAVMRPGRAGSMRGHIGPVTCQLEVLVSIMPAAAAVGTDHGCTQCHLAEGREAQRPPPQCRHLQRWLRPRHQPPT